MFLIFSISGFAQKSRSIQFDMGISQTHKDFFQLYNGIIDIGGGYHLGLTKNIFAGLSFHVNYLNRKNTKMRAVVYKPKINLQYYIHITKGIAIVPGLSGGYALINIRNSEYGYSELQKGLNLEAELKTMLTRQAKTDFYLFGRFDYIYLGKDTEFTLLNHYRNVYLTSFGIGINIKSYGKKK